MYTLCKIKSVVYAVFKKMLQYTVSTKAKAESDKVINVDNLINVMQWLQSGPEKRLKDWLPKSVTGDHQRRSVKKKKQDNRDSDVHRNQRTLTS